MYSIPFVAEIVIMIHCLQSFSSTFYIICLSVRMRTIIVFIVVGICKWYYVFYISLLLTSSVQTNRLEKKGESTTPLISDAENQTQYTYTCYPTYSKQ